MQKIKFDTTEILYPTTWQEQPNTIKNTFQTEAGTDQEIIARKDKLSISCGFKCTGDWVGIFKTFSQKDYFALSQYDPLTNAEETRVVRMEGFSYSLVPKTWDIQNINGVWEVSFRLEEF